MEVQVFSCAHKNKSPGCESIRGLIFCAGEDLNGASKFCEHAKQRAGAQTKLFDEKVLVAGKKRTRALLLRTRKITLEPVYFEYGN